MSAVSDIPESLTEDTEYTEKKRGSSVASVPSVRAIPFLSYGHGTFLHT